MFLVLDRSGSLEIPVEIFVRADGFEIDQPHRFLNGVTKQVKLSLTAEFVDIQACQICFLAFPDRRFG